MRSDHLAEMFTIRPIETTNLMETKMKPTAVVIAQFAAVFLAATSFAQGTSWQPSSIPPLSFDRAAAAKIYPDKSGNNILGLISFENVTVSQNVTKMRTEQKSRMVTHPKTGEQLEQRYIVCVPYSEVVERTKIVSRRFEVPLENAKFWTIGGKSLSSNEAVETLAATRRCFSIEYQPDFYNYEGEPFFAAMLKDDVLVIWYDKDKAKEIPAEKK
jgi:hypothetical protein